MQGLDAPFHINHSLILHVGNVLTHFTITNWKVSQCDIRLLANSSVTNYVKCVDFSVKITWQSAVILWILQFASLMYDMSTSFIVSSVLYMDRPASICRHQDLYPPVTCASTCSRNLIATSPIYVKNFHGSFTTVVRAQNDTSKTANITDTIFDRTYCVALTSDGVLKIGEIRRSVSC